MTTTLTGVEDTGLSDDQATEALLKKWTDAGTLSSPDEGADTPDRRTPETARNTDAEEDNESDDDLDLSDEDDDQDEGTDADADDNDKDDKADEPVVAADEAVVKITVDGEERNVPVKDLKRLFGQEASLTRKSQEVAQQRKAAEDEGARFTLATSKLLERAQERFKPYAEIDWQIAGKTLDNDEFIALRKEAQAAFEDLKFLNEELDGTFKQTQDERAKSVQEAAKEAVKALSDPETGIPGWSKDMYEGLMDYASTQGFEREAIAQVIDPNVIKLIHKAKLYDDAKARAATKRKAASTKRTMKTTSRPNAPLGKRASKPALDRLAKSGSTDDAVAALLARWEDQSD